MPLSKIILSLGQRIRIYVCSRLLSAKRAREHGCVQAARCYIPGLANALVLPRVILYLRIAAGMESYVCVCAGERGFKD